MIPNSNGRRKYTGSCKERSANVRKYIESVEITYDVVFPTSARGIFLYKLTLKTFAIKNDIYDPADTKIIKTKRNIP